jgi:anaerobic magnesium-protoporphyrin IX monomethyl ester cyclase
VRLPDPAARTVMRWYYGIGKRVWPHEIWHFLFRDRRRSDGPTLTEFWGPPLDAEEALLR